MAVHVQAGLQARKRHVPVRQPSISIDTSHIMTRTDLRMPAVCKMQMQGMLDRLHHVMQG